LLISNFTSLLFFQVFVAKTEYEFYFRKSILTKPVAGYYYIKVLKQSINFV